MTVDADSIESRSAADTDAGGTLSGVWADLVGQEAAVAVLRRAVASAANRAGAAAGHASGMTHAWLITGPPGSGRSNAARAFAAALQCERQGCGQCRSCRSVLAGSNPDVTLVRTEQLSLRVEQIRDLVLKAAMSPAVERWQVLVVEDADRLTEQAADALLKSLEEPPPRTVWVLCAPTVEDAVPTIRSRCRLLVLGTPSTDAVARALQGRFGVDPAMATFAARASQGHIGRARALATNEEVRRRRQEVLSIPHRLTGVPACLQAAQELIDAAAAEAAATTSELDDPERGDLERALGIGTRGAPKPRHAQAALKELDEQQKVRAKRLQRDALDRALLDLVTYYRDVLTAALDPTRELVNEEFRAEIEERATRESPERALRAVDAILACREAVTANVAPLLAAETMLIALWRDDQ